MPKIKKSRYNTLSFLQQKQIADWQQKELQQRLLMYQLWKLGISMNWKSQLIP